MSMNGDLHSENYSLRRQLEALLHEARRNEDKMRRFDLLERRLIGAGSLVELVRLLLSEYKQAFAVEVVTLALVDREGEATRVLDSQLAGDGEAACLSLLPAATVLEPLYDAERRPWLGRYDAFAHAEVFGECGTVIESVALLPLTRHGELIGSLHFGSADAGRYDASCGTDFLERLSAVISVCLESALNQERLKLVGLTDGLTGVQNRRYFEHRCQVEISQARRYRHSLACMFLDVDKFKRINDSHGHPTGDQVLRTVAATIQAQLRAGDTVARYGGEEFVVLLPQTAAHHAREIAERIRLSIAGRNFQAVSGHALAVTISIGLSMLPADAIDEDTDALAARLVAAADQALYQAKHSGRNRVVCDERQAFGAEEGRLSWRSLAGRVVPVLRSGAALLAGVWRRVGRV